MTGQEREAMRIEPATSCNVAPSLASQWRNGPHWHTVWPEGDHWCYPTAEAAADRAVEVTELRTTERVAHIKADAWDKGERAGRGGGPGRGIVPNPYRADRIGGDR